MEESSGIRTGASSIAFQQPQRCELQDFRKIGVGGFGIVYKAKHKTLGDVAVKKCRLNSQTEVDGLAKPGLNKFIVQILGWIQPTQTDCCSYIVMEYMELGSLKEFSRKLKPFPDSVKIKMVSDVIGAMHFLHDKGMIHRDLKLENIFVGNGLSVKVGDLGLATWESVEDPTKATSGTVTHMAPELLTDINVPATKMSDVYSFGVTLWELSTRRDPYEYAHNDMHIKMAVLDGQTPDMKDFPKDVPYAVKDMMERAWHQAQGKRPTFEVLKKEIEKEYDANYKTALSKDLSLVYKLLDQCKKESSVTCPSPWSKDITDSRLPEGNVSMHEPEPGPLRSFDQPTNGSIPEKKPVTVSDTEKGELPGVRTAMANLVLDVGQKAVQAESDATQESLYPPRYGLAPHSTTEEFKLGIPTQESQHKSPETSKPPSFHNQPQSQQQTGHYPQQNRPIVPDPWSGGIPTQESRHKSSETSKPPSFLNQPQSQQQTGHYPQQNRPFVPDQRSQGCNLYISGQGHTVILADRGGTVTMPESQEEEKGGKQTGRRNNSDTMHKQKEKKMDSRQDSPSSSDSESDVLDPKVVEIMSSSKILKEKHISKVSADIGFKWKELGRELGLRTAQLENIQYNCHLDGLREMAFQVMLKWKQMKGGATKGELAKALVKVGLSEVSLMLK